MKRQQAGSNVHVVQSLPSNGCANNHGNGVGNGYSNGSVKHHDEKTNGVAYPWSHGHQRTHTWGKIALIIFVTILTTNLPYFLWYAERHCGGSILRLVESFEELGFLGGMAKIWSEVHIASPLSVGVLVGYTAWSLLLMVTLPGPLVEGPPTQKGYTPQYRDNGFACYVVTMIAFTVLAVLLPRYTPYSVTIVYDHFDEFIGTLTVYSHVICLMLVVKGHLWPSNADCGSTGSFVFDYYWGMELHPRIAGIDIKVFTNCRFGMTVWPLLVCIYALKSYELYGFVDSMWVSAVLQMVYFTKFFWWEAGYMRTIDIVVDRAGYYICWGCLVYVPGIYGLVSRYLVSHPNQLGPFWSAVILLTGLTSCYVNYDADRQKLQVRRTDGRCLVWGRPPKVIRAVYRLDTGETRTSLLLVSGYWGLARHFHYLPELTLALMWSIPALFDNIMPYAYMLSLFGLLLHRTYRDDVKCLTKYGEYWKEYCRQVPYKIIPHVF